MIACPPADPRSDAVIPRLVHTSWRDGNLPRFQATLRNYSMRVLGPGWLHLLWTDDENRRLVADCYPHLLALYDGYDHHIKRVDMVRYLYLIAYGGVYMDLDSVVLRQLDNILRPAAHGAATAVFGYAHKSNTLSTYGSVANAFMASPPNHPFLLQVAAALHAHAGRDVLHATGPNFLTSQLKIYLKPADLKPPAGEAMPTKASAAAVAPVVLHPMPRLYASQWNGRNPCCRTHRPSSCNVSHAGLRECARLLPQTVVNTFWTHQNTWKRMPVVRKAAIA